MGRAWFIIYPFFFSSFCLLPDAYHHSAILKIGVNHGICCVYSPKAVEILIHGQCYGYVKYIFSSFIRVGFGGNNKYAMEFSDILAFTFAT